MVKTIKEKLYRSISGLFVAHIFERLDLYSFCPEEAAKDVCSHIVAAIACHIPDIEEPIHHGDRARLRGDYTARFSRVLHRGLNEAAKNWQSERIV